MTKEAESVQIGSERLIYLPYLMSERTPHLDPDCRGVFFGLSAIHERRHLIRAVMEGVGYSLCDCAQILKEMGVALQDMKACGGGGKSALWRQMLADLYECPVATLRADEGPAMGAAILAGVGAGLYESVEAGCERIIQMNEALNPITENTRKYKGVYKLYQKLYNDLKDTFKQLAAV
jgi:xylulokinase